MTVARELADFVVRTDFADLPALAAERAEMVIASTLASAAAGCEISSSRIMRELARERAGTPEASIWFDAGSKLPAADVARTNATFSDAAASDDSDLRNIAHIGTIITSVSIAMAERTAATGRDVLSAMVLGYEIAGRLGEAVTPGYAERGFHAGMITIFAGAVTAGKLLKLTQPQMAQAIAIAATSIGGLYMAANTSLAREYDAGLSALLGVHAALAAQKGFLSEETVLEGPRGYFETYGGKDVGSVTRDWGKSWDIATDMAIKLVPGAHSFHAAAEAAINAAIAGNINPEEVESIAVSGPELRAIRGPVHPTDLIGVAHSLPYFLGCAVADREYTWAHATPEKMADPRIAGLADKVRAAAPAAPGVDFGRNRYGATVTITTKDGRSYSDTVIAPRGSGARGIDWADIDAKYQTLMPNAQLSARQIGESLSVIHRFDQVRAMSELLDLLR
jgi:2-methylcitrate dehydratase PrpD